jgi:hypothetical protein
MENLLSDKVMLLDGSASSELERLGFDHKVFLVVWKLHTKRFGIELSNSKRAFII